MSGVISQLPAGVLRANEGEQLTQAGTNLTFKSLGGETGGAVLILEQQSPPGAIVPAHIHQTEDEFIYLLEGELEATIGETTHTVRPGDLVKMPKGQPHGGGAATSPRVSGSAAQGSHHPMSQAYSVKTVCMPSRRTCVSNSAR